MEKNNLREEKKLQYRQKILDAAAVEFEKRGFINTSVSNIMQTADLGVGTFYNYFSSKEEVLMNLVKNLFAGKKFFFARTVENCLSVHCRTN